MISLEDFFSYLLKNLINNQTHFFWSLWNVCENQLLEGILQNVALTKFQLKKTFCYLDFVLSSWFLQFFLEMTNKEITKFTKFILQLFICISKPRYQYRYFYRLNETW